VDPIRTLAPDSTAPLRLETALQLLQHAGHVLPQGAEMSMPWLQSLIDGLCDLSCRDALTGLVNRRTFQLALDREVDRVARAGEPALMLVVDIDHFKKVNDVHGHAAGDLVLKAVAKALLDTVRPMDTVARVGGEEFAIILPNCPPAFAPAVAERVRRGVERARIVLASDATLAVSVSLGGAFAPPWVRSAAALWIERADQQLYRAKDGGRNRACLEQPAISQVSAEEKDLLFHVTQRQDLE
jgi:diguanylate cyclase